MNPTLPLLTRTRTRIARHQPRQQTRALRVGARARAAPPGAALASGARHHARSRLVARLTPLLYVDASSRHGVKTTLTQKQAPTPSNVLGIFGLSIRTQERDLDDEFSRFGRVEKVTIVYDQRVRPPRHTGYPLPH